jgi:hypothetical protein
MKRIKLWAGVILVFVSGLVIGSLATGHFLRAHVREFVDGGPVRANKHIVSRLTNRLDLTEEQAAAIEEIRLRTESRMGEITEDFFPQMEGLMEGQVKEIRAVLTEEQRAKYDERAEKLRRRHDRFIGRDPEARRDR